MIIKTVQLCKTFNAGKPNEVKAVQQANLEVAAGSCLLLKGASGSGKSTLLTLLSCLARPTSGEYECLGEKVSRWSEKFLTRFRQEHIGIVFQHFNLVKGLSVADNVSLPLLPRRMNRRQIDQAVHHAVEQVNISHRLHFKVDTLSGGELQRVAIARALVSNPQLLFADEPTAHLDSHSSVRILDIFQHLKAEGKTIILTTHDPLVETHPMIDRKIIVKDGCITDL